MKSNFSKSKVLKYLKAKGIVVEETDKIEISERQNISSKNNGTLQKLYIENLNETSKYFKLNPETGTFLQPHGKKVENIIIEYTNRNELKIVLVELKSKTVIRTDIKEKFQESLNWLYLLLSLEHENLDLKIFGIVVAQRKLNWNSSENLNVLLSTNVRYKLKSFHTENRKMKISWNDILK
jgi:hypothetical protein